MPAAVMRNGIDARRRVLRDFHQGIDMIVGEQITASSVRRENSRNLSRAAMYSGLERSPRKRLRLFENLLMEQHGLAREWPC